MYRYRKNLIATAVSLAVGALSTFSTAIAGEEEPCQKILNLKQEADCSFKIMDKEGMVGVAWQQGSEALALELPEFRFLAKSSEIRRCRWNMPTTKTIPSAKEAAAATPVPLPCNWRPVSRSKPS